MAHVDTSLRSRSGWAAPLVIAAGWGAAIAVIASRGLLVTETPVPARLILAVGLPPLAFLAAWNLVPAVRAWVAAADAAVVTGLQSFRVVGAMFLFLWGLDQLPAVFAFPAALGDVAVGLMAMPAALAVARGDAGWRRGVGAVIAAGLADFTVVFAAAVLASPGMPLALAGAPSPGMMQSLPMAMIPAFAVPAFIILHIVAWLKLIR